MRKIAVWAVTALFPLSIFASQIILKDGTRYNGVFLSGSSSNIEFQDDNGQRRQFNIQDVQSLSFDQSGSSGSYRNDNARDNRNDRYSSRNRAYRTSDAR